MTLKRQTRQHKTSNETKHESTKGHKMNTELKEDFKETKNYYCFQLDH